MDCAQLAFVLSHLNVSFKCVCRDMHAKDTLPTPKANPFIR